ncbi:MAG: PAS domain S-box protein [Nitrospinota bacterium]|nr:PAS domain S-box protein [Nitrospinota bacterium]
MNLKEKPGYLAGLTLLLTFGLLVLWEFWLESFILVNYLDLEVNKNSLDRWAFVVACLSIVCFSLILPFKSMKKITDENDSLETALKGEQILSKVFFNVDNSIILVIDTSNRIMQINQKTSHLLGFKEEEMTGKDWISFLVPEKNQEAVKHQYKQFVNDKNQNFTRFTTPALTKSGAEKIVDWQCSPLRDDKGQIYGSINSGQDISEPIRLRNELSQIRGKLEPQIKKLTSELNFNKKKYHSEAIKTANAKARFKFWFDLESSLMGLTSPINNDPAEVNKRISKALKLFGELSDVDQGYVFKFTSTGSQMINSHLWVAGEPLLEPDSGEEISLDNFTWFKKKIQNQEVIHIPDVKAMPKEAHTEKEVYLSQGIKSLINVPIIHNDSVVGYLGFESSQKEKVWDNDEINLIKVIARLIASTTNAQTKMEDQSTSAIPEISLESEPLLLESTDTSPQDTSPSIKEELKKAKLVFEKEYQEKLKEMEKARSQLMSELKERKQAEADLRNNRDSIERQLGEKSLQLEKLLSEPETKGTRQLDSQSNLKISIGDDANKESENLRKMLQKKEAELTALQAQLKTKSMDSSPAEIEDYKIKISKKDEEIQSLKNKFEEEQSARTRLQEQLKEIEESLSAQIESIKPLQEANQMLEEELTELRKLQGEFETNSDLLEDTKQELESLEIANEQLMTDVEEKNFLIDEAKEKASRYEQMDLPIFTLDQDGNILTWNKTAASTTGYISELALESPISIMFAEKDEFDFENEFLAPLKENSRHRIEIPIKKPNGQIFNALISLASFKDRNGIVSTLGYLVNLSDSENEGEINAIKRQFTTLLGHSGLILVNLSSEYHVSDMNEKAESTFDWNREDIQDKNFFEEVLPNETWEEVFSDIQERMTAQDTVELETHTGQGDSKKYYLWNLAKEIDPKDQSVKGIIALAQDVTEIRNAKNNLNQAQGELRENQLLLNLLVDKAEDGLIRIDENGIIQSFNQGAEKLFGYMPREIIGKNVSILMPDPYSKEHDNYIKDYIETGHSNFVGGAPKELIGKNKGGSIFPVEITLRETYKGYQRQIVGVVRDISKRKKLEIKLFEIEEKYKRFLDAESGAILVINAETQEIMEANSTALHLYGYDREEFLSQNFRNLMAQDDSSMNDDTAFSGSGLGSAPQESKLYQSKKDGTLFPAKIITSAFQSNDIHYELKIVHDITNEIQLQEALNSKETELEEKDIEMDEKLNDKESQIKELIAQREQIKIALRDEKFDAIEHITDSMVDLVNNPIQGIENILEQVKERAEMADIHKGLVTVAMNECRRVADLVGKLRNYQPPTDDDLEPLNIHQVIDDILQNNMDSINQHTITLERNYADDLPTIAAVTNQIRQAINNLIKNAEESFGDNEGKIIISTEQDGSNVKIHIQDTGCGIPEKDKDRIFEPFYTTKSAIHRPGLGLLATLGIVKNHKGEIDVNSRPGEGTTITVTLPMRPHLNSPNGDH